MAKLEDLKRGEAVAGLVANSLATIVDVAPRGPDCVELTYKDEQGGVGARLVYAFEAEEMAIVQRERRWDFGADGDALKLASEANRIRFAYLFDPLLAIHTSAIDPLPHQITAVYGEMLMRQPLRFLLADDPGAGKTIMAGLLIKELRARGDVERCLICAPGSLVEQWQDEMQLKFGLPFEIIGRERIESSLSGNPFAEEDFVIGRLDQMARSEEIQAKLDGTEWDLVVCDEAHKMSAHFYGQEIEETKRYRLGRQLGFITRHLLLMTATPHSGKHENFQLFMRLIDPDRFEGKPRTSEGMADASDLMRRMVKEDLCKFDGTPLFPERRAYTIDYELSPAEQQLYQDVTAYVTEEMNRADRLRDAGQAKRGNNVGFALTVLQRRLASSPEAIYRSLERRRARLEAELEDVRRRGGHPAETLALDMSSLPDLTDEDDYEDFYDRPEDEVFAQEDEVLDRATAAMTVQELELEIESLIQLEQQAKRVRDKGSDRKWDELASILQDRKEMFDDNGGRRKLIIFTEHRDTLNHLYRRITTFLAQPESVVVIHGGIKREERRAAQERFVNDPTATVLIATDAAGEGVNLQRAHLMINYDLPWNPNRIEQRFGRIHRIGQTEVCHLWNLVAGQTREGAVYQRLLTKLESVSSALQGKVFDVLGELYTETSLRDMLIEAIRYGDNPEKRAELFRKIEAPFDPDRLRELFQQHALAADTMDASELRQVREDMERAEACRLQPHYIRSFFEAAFTRMGGRISPRETGRYEITRVPSALRKWRSCAGRAQPITDRYERVCFEKAYMTLQGKPRASLICPGHPLLDGVINLTLQQHRALLRRGAVLVDERDEGVQPRVLLYLEHEISNSMPTSAGAANIVSRRMQFVEVMPDGKVRDAGAAPYLDYRPLAPEEQAVADEVLSQDWLDSDLDKLASDHAVQHLVPKHMAEVRDRVHAQVDKTLEAVRKRLTAEMAYWDRRSNELKAQELAGKKPRLNSGLARQRADEMEARLKAREEDLARQRALSAKPPVLIGAALVLPIGLIRQAAGDAAAEVSKDAEARKVIERLAVEKVMEVERSLGREPTDVGVPGHPYDIESRIPETGELLMIEVKGRASAADTVCVTKNEMLVGFNKADKYILAIVMVEDGVAQEPKYVRKPFDTEPGFAVTSVNLDIDKLLARAEEPS